MQVLRVNVDHWQADIDLCLSVSGEEGFAQRIIVSTTDRCLSLRTSPLKNGQSTYTGRLGMSKTTGRVESRLAELGIDLAGARTPPVARYDAVKASGSLLYVSGHGPFLNGKPHIVGKVPSQVDVAKARRAARLAALNCVSSIADALGDLDRVTSVLRVFGMVNADPSFIEHATVIDGASEVIIEIFGEIGRHTRAAVGMGSLPFGISVEIEMVIGIR